MLVNFAASNTSLEFDFTSLGRIGKIDKPYQPESRFSAQVEMILLTLRTVS